MMSTVLLEYDRAEVESAVHFLSEPRLTPTLAETHALLERVLAKAKRLDYLQDAPLQALRNKKGMEASAFHRLCRAAVALLDICLTLMALARQLTERAAVREGAALPDMRDFDCVEGELRQARGKIEKLLLAASTLPPIDWERVKRGEEAMARGEGIRLNPDLSTAGQ